MGHPVQHFIPIFNFLYYFKSRLNFISFILAKRDDAFGYDQTGRSVESKIRRKITSGVLNGRGGSAALFQWHDGGFQRGATHHQKHSFKLASVQRGRNQVLFGIARYVSKLVKTVDCKSWTTKNRKNKICARNLYLNEAHFCNVYISKTNFLD